MVFTFLLKVQLHDSESFSYSQVKERKKERFFSIGDHSPLMVPEITTMYTFIYIDLKTTYFHKGKT